MRSYSQLAGRYSALFAKNLWEFSASLDLSVVSSLIHSSSRMRPFIRPLFVPFDLIFRKAAVSLSPPLPLPPPNALLLLALILISKQLVLNTDK